MTIRELINWGRPFRLPVIQKGRYERSLASLQDDVHRLFEGFFERASPTAWFGYDSFPSVDIIENDKDFKIKAEMPGIDPDKVEVSVTEGFLTIKGERKEETEEKDENYLRREMSYGSFQRTIALPATAESAKAEASFKNGILTVQILKKAEALKKPTKLPIKKAA